MELSQPIFPIFYLAPIEYYVVLMKYNEVIFEQHEHFIKQTYRNRCSIYGANGKLNLIIPLERTGNRRTIKDIKISNETNWQNLHWRSLQAAYRSSPYFEYYEEDLISHYEKNYSFLMDFNIELHEKIKKILKIETTHRFTEKYNTLDASLDFRNKFEAKKENTLVNFENKNYIQVFSDKYGFIKNLSICDLLFNEGPNSINYLKNLS